MTPPPPAPPLPSSPPRSSTVGPWNDLTSRGGDDSPDRPLSFYLPASVLQDIEAGDEGQQDDQQPVLTPRELATRLREETGLEARRHRPDPETAVGESATICDVERRIERETGNANPTWMEIERRLVAEASSSGATGNEALPGPSSLSEMPVRISRVPNPNPNRRQDHEMTAARRSQIGARRGLLPDVETAPVPAPLSALGPVADWASSDHESRPLSATSWRAARRRHLTEMRLMELSADREARNIRTLRSRLRADAETRRHSTAGLEARGRTGRTELETTAAETLAGLGNLPTRAPSRRPRFSDVFNWSAIGADFGDRKYFSP